MKTAQTLSKQILVFSLIGISIVYLIANLLNEQDYPITENWYPTTLLFIMIPGVAIFLGITLLLRYKVKGSHGISWIFFTVAMICWFLGEWTYAYDYEYDINDLSTMTSDIFYILGYPFFFAFNIFYLKPRKRVISKKMIYTALFVSLLFVVPTLYFTFNTEEEIDEFTMFLYAIYPILDSIILAPSIIVVSLFLRGEVNFMWALILFGTILFIIADTIYLVTSIGETYYPGHPMDIPYLWAYSFYAVGAYYNISLFKKHPEVKTTKN